MRLADENIIKAIEEALSIINKAKIDLALRPVAYQEVLRYLIQVESSSVAEEASQKSYMEREQVSPLIQSLESFEDYRVYLRDKVKTKREKVLATIYWLKVKEEKDCVTSQDISERLEKDPEWRVPKNLPRDLKEIQKKGWITKSMEGNKECWELAGSGKKKINEWLNE
jgi:hypothetical protein